MIDAEHLHIRGEQWWYLAVSSTGSGTPPRPWRADARRARLPENPRNTSTSVESSPQLPHRHRRAPEHLHVRGEQPIRTATPPMTTGTPPRPWRAVDEAHDRLAEPRNTSTSVESSLRHQRPCPRSPEHLHVRGEQAVMTASQVSAYGTPPRPWRADRAVWPVVDDTRNTSTSVESRAIR